MSGDEITKKKLPRNAEHLLQIEDHLKKVEGIIREIRQEMRESEMETVDLATGTIFHYLHLVEALAHKYRGEFETQRTAHKVKVERERARQERDRGTGKGARRT